MYVLTISSNLSGPRFIIRLWKITQLSFENRNQFIMVHPTFLLWKFIHHDTEERLKSQESRGKFFLSSCLIVFAFSSIVETNSTCSVSLILFSFEYCSLCLRMSMLIFVLSMSAFAELMRLICTTSYWLSSYPYYITCIQSTKGRIM